MLKTFGRAGKRLLIAAGAFVALGLVGFASPSEAQAAHGYGYCGPSHGHGYGGYEVFYGGYGPSHLDWHDTSHYDWHDTSHWDWHGDHYDYHRSGHYDFHPQGHYDVHGGGYPLY